MFPPYLRCVEEGIIVLLPGLLLLLDLLLLLLRNLLQGGPPWGRGQQPLGAPWGPFGGRRLEPRQLVLVQRQCLKQSINQIINQSIDQDLKVK